MVKIPIFAMFSSASRPYTIQTNIILFNLHCCSFLLTAEEKEPKKTATPKPLQRGFSLFRGKPLSIKVFVWLAKPVPLRGEPCLLRLRVAGRFWAMTDNRYSFLRLYSPLVMSSVVERSALPLATVGTQEIS